MLQAPGAALLCSALAAHVQADVAGTFDLSNRTEVRARDTQSNPPVTPSAALDLADTVTSRVGLRTHAWTYTLGYSITATQPDVELGFSPLIFQNADAGVTWQGRRAAIGAAEYVSYGFENTATTGIPASPTGGAAPPTPGVTTLAAPGTLQFGSSRSVLTASDRLTRAATLTLTVEYDVQGGLDATSRASMPLVQGPRADALFGYQLDRRNWLETHAYAQRSEASAGICSPFIPSDLIADPKAPCDPVGVVAQATETWRHAVSRRTTLYVGAGAAAAAVRLQDEQAQYRSVTLPVGLAGVAWLNHLQGLVGSMSLDAAAAPFIDLRTGIVDERAQLLGSLRLGARRVTYIGTLGATQSIDPVFMQPITSVQALGEVDYELSRAVTVGGGLRYSWQTQTGFGEFSVFTLFGQVTVSLERVKF